MSTNALRREMGDLAGLDVGNTAASTSEGSFEAVRPAYAPEEAEARLRNILHDEGEIRDIPKPEWYYGDRENDACWLWLQQFDNWVTTWNALKARNMSDALKIIYAEGRFRGLAMAWSFDRKAELNSTPMVLQVTWEEWITKLETAFGDFRSDKNRRDEWEILQQMANENVVAFAQRVDQGAIRLRPRPSEFEKLRILQSGLRYSLTDRLAILPDTFIPKAWREYVEYAARQESEMRSALLSRQMRTRQTRQPESYFGAPPRAAAPARAFPSPYRNRASAPLSQSRWTPSGEARSERSASVRSDAGRSIAPNYLDHDGDTLMGMNQLTARTRDASKAEYSQRCRNEGLCFNCERPGHQKANCPDLSAPRSVPRNDSAPRRRGRGGNRSGSGNALRR